MLDLPRARRPAVPSSSRTISIRVFNIGDGVGNPVTRVDLQLRRQAPQRQRRIDGLPRLFNHPQLVPRYYAALLDALNTWFNNGDARSAHRSDHGRLGAATDARRRRTAASTRSRLHRRAPRERARGNPAELFAERDGNGPPIRRRVTDAPTTARRRSAARSMSRAPIRSPSTAQLAQWFYRTSGPDAAGTWTLSVPAGGGSVLSPGLNTVVVQFLGRSPAAPATSSRRSPRRPLSAGSAGHTERHRHAARPSARSRLSRPASYMPGMPFLVRIDQKDALGNLDRTAWNRTVTSPRPTASTVTPNTVTLTTAWAARS